MNKKCKLSKDRMDNFALLLIHCKLKYNKAKENGNHKRWPFKSRYLVQKKQFKKSQNN